MSRKPRTQASGARHGECAHAPATVPGWTWPLAEPCPPGATLAPGLAGEPPVRGIANVPFYFGGTSLLIVVVVVMDFTAQIQAHLTSHQYESLMKKANLKGGARGLSRG